MTNGLTLTVCTGTSYTVAPLRPIWNEPPGMLMYSGLNVTGFGAGLFGFSGTGFSGTGFSGFGFAGVGLLGHKTQAPTPPPINTNTMTAAITYGNIFFFAPAAAGWAINVG